MASPASPLKNRPYILEVFNILEARGLKTKRLYGYRRKEMAELLNRGKVLFHPSVTEGMSRLISEAAACGVIPVVDKDVTSTSKHALWLNGYALNIGSVLAADGLSVITCQTSASETADRLIEICQKTETQTQRDTRRRLVVRDFNIRDEEVILTNLVMNLVLQ